MKPVLFVLCDAATESAGKLNILGIFDTFLAKEVPFIHPMFCIAVRIAATVEDIGEHKIELIIRDETKTDIIHPLESSFRVTENQYRQTGTGNLIASLRDMKFEKFGTYTLSILLDGKELDSLPFHVIKLEP